MVVLDTDLLISHLREKNKAPQILQNLREQNHTLNTTIFNAAELYKGCYSMKNVAKGLMKMNALLESLNEILLFDDKAAQDYAKISADLKKRGSSIGVLDELIASVCIGQDEVFYTGNIKHFERVENLTVVNWKDL